MLVGFRWGTAALDLETRKWSDLEGSDGLLFRSPDGKYVADVSHLGDVYIHGTDPKERFFATLGFNQRAIDWLPDSRRFYSRYWPHIGYDVKTGRRLGTFMLDVRGEPFVIGPTGHYRGNPEVEKHIVYVVQFEDGRNETFTPAEFAKKFNWKNDPSKARFLKLDDEK